MAANFRFGRLTTLAIILAATATVAAHDIPADLVVQALFKAEGQRMDVLVRAPLTALRDIDFPQRPPGFLELDRLDDLLRRGAYAWIADNLTLYENGNRVLAAPTLIAARISLPSDRSFASYDDAVRHVSGPPLPSGTDLLWNQAFVDVRLEYPIASATSDFSVRSGLARLGIRVLTVLRFTLPGTPERAFEFTGDPGLIRLDPRWHQAAAHFVALGFAHILDGIDHLLFLLCLVLPFRRLKPLVLIVTSFTVAHSITLIASAMDFAPGALWFPPLVETLIAASIVYMALENIVGVTNVSRRWAITFAFGLVHGFGFSFALRETLQFAGSHLLTSLVAFNVGVELGQLLVLAIVIPALHFAFTRIVAERIGIVIISAIVAHTAWHWMVERGAGLSEYDWSALRPDSPGNIVRWIMALVMVAAAIWLLSSRRSRQRPSAS